MSDAFAGFVDDASPYLPGQPGLPAQPGQPGPASDEGGHVGARLVVDTELPLLRGQAGPVKVRLSGGAGQVAGPAGLAARLGLELVALEVTLRDHDDPAANARRVVAAVDAARSEGSLDEGVAVHVRVGSDPTRSWLAAADEVAAAELALTLPLDGPLDAWIDAALDRELAFSLTSGSVDDAVAALQTTARLWGDPDDLLAARRWCRSWATADPAAAVARLAVL